MFFLVFRILGIVRGKNRKKLGERYFWLQSLEVRARLGHPRGSETRLVSRRVLLYYTDRWSISPQDISRKLDCECASNAVKRCRWGSKTRHASSLLRRDALFAHSSRFTNAASTCRKNVHPLSSFFFSLCTLDKNWTKIFVEGQKIMNRMSFLFFLSIIWQSGFALFLEMLGAEGIA